ncbi:hypothetical protein AWC05_27420 [Mycobacterium florentinum]|uniref:Uncharacterized protein n=1 Tax=Mycobacterium florentinum TaxID=292462 RepID=A0A1X1U3R5_MYCFL|nr:hypothetical protein AWC05_27420 [Mycobacterium florentinum]BBX80482.1 hypothetical protein MFLOJ_42690 [Mycobacterium florentinum]
MARADSDRWDLATSVGATATMVAAQRAFNDLVYHGQRSHLIDHIKARGWSVSSHTVKELNAANGFQYPDDEVAQAFADVTYSSAVLTR